MAKPIASVYRDFETAGVPSSGPYNPLKAEIRDLLTAHYGYLTGGIAGAIVKTSKSALDGDLDHDPDVMAWVIGDATAANNGVYQKSGASGAGSWTKRAPLPYPIIRLNNADAGTANAIIATTASGVPDSAYEAVFVLNVTAANTGAVTVAVDGASAKDLVTNTGDDIPAGYLTAGMAALCVDDGAAFRLFSYGDASGAEATAVAAAALAVDALADVESVQQSIHVYSKIYADTASGLSGTSEGDQFGVVSSDDVIIYQHDSGPVATEVGRYPQAERVRDNAEEVSKQRYLRLLSTAYMHRPKAAIVILLGQSLSVSRGTIALAQSDTNARMFVEGACVNQWDFFSLSATHSCNWDSVASVVEYDEGATQSPGVGIIRSLAGSSFARTYLCSCAVGARTFSILRSNGPRSNVYAAVHRMCDIARADGYDPVVMFYSAHGEADALSATGTDTYYTQGLAFYRMAQLCAAQAMGRPDYIAPVALSQPIQQDNGDDDRDIKEAIRRIVRDLPNAIDIGAIYQWPNDSDNVHPTPAAYVMRGEVVGQALRAWWERGERPMTPQIVEVILDGTDFTVVFNRPVVQDTSLGVGEGLNAANAMDGFEWDDDGSFIEITGLTYSGRTVTGTLNSAPVGSIGDQRLRIAVQEASPGSGAVNATRAGSQVRASGDGNCPCSIRALRIICGRSRRWQP